MRGQAYPQTRAALLDHCGCPEPERGPGRLGVLRQASAGQADGREALGCGRGGPRGAGLLSSAGSTARGPARPGCSRPQAQIRDWQVAGGRPPLRRWGRAAEEAPRAPGLHQPRTWAAVCLRVCLQVQPHFPQEAGRGFRLREPGRGWLSLPSSAPPPCPVRKARGSGSAGRLGNPEGHRIHGPRPAAPPSGRGGLAPHSGRGACSPPHPHPATRAGRLRSGRRGGR